MILRRFLLIRSILGRIFLLILIDLMYILIVLFSLTLFDLVVFLSIVYTMKYISKKSQIPVHELDDREKEFALMSKRLGENYINDKTIKWHRDKILLAIFSDSTFSRVSLIFDEFANSFL